MLLVLIFSFNLYSDPEKLSMVVVAVYTEIALLFVLEDAFVS